MGLSKYKKHHAHHLVGNLRLEVGLWPYHEQVLLEPLGEELLLIVLQLARGEDRLVLLVVLL